MKKHSIKLTALVLALVLTAALALTGCGSKSDDSDGATTIQIAVPNDTTNEARALLLLQDNGIIKLADGAGITATKNDIVENPYNVEIVETEAAQIPNILQDVDYAVINSNYAINAGLNPVADSLVIEGSASAYANILAVKEGNESSPKVLALIAALESQQVVDYINEKYDGSVVSTVDTPTDGFDATVDYDALAGETISIAASPTPHAEILEVVKEILAEKNITLDIQVYNDYVVPNTVVEDGTVDANYFQHKPYLDDFNAQKGTKLSSMGGVHYEPFGIYAGKCKSLKDLKKGAIVAVPNDATNEGRALLLMQDQGLITLKDGVGLTATVRDIKENPKKLRIEEIEAAQLVRALPDVDIAIINGNYAILGGLKVADALAVEAADSAAATTYANILAIRTGDEKRPELQALYKALCSDKIKEFMKTKYEGAVLATH